MTKGDGSPSQKVTKKFSPANYHPQVTKYVFSARLRLKTATHPSPQAPDSVARRTASASRIDLSVDISPLMLS